jgi:hypothetical protein
MIIQQNCEGNKLKSYKIMRMNMFAKPYIENIRGLNLAMVNLMTFQVYKLSL